MRLTLATSDGTGGAGPGGMGGAAGPGNGKAAAFDGASRIVVDAL